MLLNHRPTKILITGKSGSGKSTYFTRYVLNAFKVHYETIFLFDHQGEFAFRNGYKACLTEEDLNGQLENGFICFDPAELFPGDTAGGFNFFCEWSFEVTRLLLQKQGQENFSRLLACDELQVLVGTDAIPFELSLILETGRRWGIDAAMVAQQVNLIHNRIRNQLTEMVSFQQTDLLVLKILEQHGFNADELSQLNTGQYVLRNFQIGTEDRGQLFASKKPVDTVPEKTDIQLD